MDYTEGGARPVWKGLQGTSSSSIPRLLVDQLVGHFAKFWASRVGMGYLLDLYFLPAINAVSFQGFANRAPFGLRLSF